MEIIIADKAGFCFGVKRAVELTEEELSIKDNKSAHSLGPLIHNPQAVKHFEEKGLKVIDSIEELEGEDPDKNKVIVRAHGVTKELIQEMEEKNLEFTDTTCPYVKSIHNRVEDFKNQGYNIIIVGDPDHPEIIGINGWCDNEGYIVNSANDAHNLPNMDKACVVCQTTYKKENFDEIVDILKEKGDDIQVFNTICNATKLRQEACRQVASQVDYMIVIGGYHSSNTRKLAEISRENCKNVIHIETLNELDLEELKKHKKIGITAGASTPDWIIKEVVERMDNINNENKEVNEEIVESEETVEEVEEVKEVETEETDMDMSEAMSEEMLDAIESSFTRINRGDVIKGEVLFVTKNEVMVNINYKSDGIITLEELSNDPEVKPKDLYAPGDEIDVFVMRMDDGEGNVVLSAKRVEEFKSWDTLEEVYNNKERIEAKVTNVVKGGLIALVSGVSGFMPASQISTQYVDDLEVYKGKTLIAKIIDFDKDKRRIILSRKEVEKEEQSNKRKELWATIEEGQEIEGIVRRLTDFGAFVDIGGVDGLVHISDLSWNRVKHPSNVVDIGQTIRVKVLSLDKERNRISLGLKQTTEEPWIAFSNNVSTGDIVEGKVVNLLDFGAFIRLKEGVDGLLHVSQISNEHVNKPSDVLEIDQMVEVKVIEIDKENKKISFSIKEIENDKIEEAAKEENEEETEEENFDTTIGDIVDSE